MGDIAAAANRVGGAAPARIYNGDFDWDRFDSRAYFDHNYGHLRPDDQQIISLVADFFQQEHTDFFQQQRLWRPKAIDAGSGANLYPALTMLPFTAELTLLERARSNCEWLSAEKAAPSPSWRQFWSHMSAGRAPYQRIKEPFDLLNRRAQVRRGNIFMLEPDTYDIGTMFFVAESITTRDTEFERATRTFVNSLRPGAPFAAAFMKDSSGYRVGDVWFPACSVDEKDIRQALEPLSRDAKIIQVDSDDLREGYGGMIVACGHRRV